MNATGGDYIGNGGRFWQRGNTQVREEVALCEVRARREKLHANYQGHTI